MDYRERLDIMSAFVIPSNKMASSRLNLFITEESLDRLSIYQIFFLGLFNKRISDDFQGLQKYLIDSNFKSLVYNYCHSFFLKTPDICEITKEFPNYLKSVYDVHQDDLIIELARIDSLWSLDKNAKLSVAKGMVSFWECLIENKKTSEITIDFNKREFVELRIVSGEKALVVRYE